jgi:REP element-mobilizing transposase RayT
MRHARLKPEYRDTWHHCYNRTVGTSDDRPFGEAEKEQFVRILRRVARFYTVRIVAYQVMSNHFHILLQSPEEQPSEEETIRRFKAFHRGKRILMPGSKLCGEWQGRLRDVSWCMRHLQHLFTAWFNRSRPVRRRGPLWAGRFKNTVLIPVRRSGHAGSISSATPCGRTWWPIRRTTASVRTANGSRPAGILSRSGSGF